MCVGGREREGERKETTFANNMMGRACEKDVRILSAREPASSCVRECVCACMMGVTVRGRFAVFCTLGRKMIMKTGVAFTCGQTDGFTLALVCRQRIEAKARRERREHLHSCTEENSNRKSPCFGAAADLSAHALTSDR